MLQYIKACFEESTLQSTELQKKTTAIYTARFTQAISNLMPHLRKCYIPEERDSLGVINIDDNALKRWNDLCVVLKENCQFCWGKWVDIAVSKVEDLTKGLPQAFTLEANIDYLMMVGFFFNKTILIFSIYLHRYILFFLFRKSQHNFGSLAMGCHQNHRKR